MLTRGICRYIGTDCGLRVSFTMYSSTQARRRRYRPYVTGRRRRYAYRRYTYATGATQRRSYAPTSTTLTRNLNSGDFQRSYFRWQITVPIASGADNFKAWSFTLSQVQNTAEVEAYQALYDSYRIKYIKITCCPRGNVHLQDNAAVNAWLNYFAVDTTDATIPTTIAELLNYRHMKFAPGTQSLTIGWMPKCAVQLYGSTNGISPQNVWVDSSKSNEQHFGLKFAAHPGGPTGTTYYLDFVITYYVDWKGRR